MEEAEARGGNPTRRAGVSQTKAHRWGRGSGGEGAGGEGVSDRGNGNCKGLEEEAGERNAFGMQKQTSKQNPRSGAWEIEARGESEAGEVAKAWLGGRHRGTYLLSGVSGECWWVFRSVFRFITRRDQFGGSASEKPRKAAP